MAHYHQRIALFESRSLSHQYRRGLTTRHGHAKKKAQHQQANLYDHRWQTQLREREKWRILHELQRSRRIHRGAMLQPSRTSQEVAHSHHDLYDSQ